MNAGSEASLIMTTIERFPELAASVVQAAELIAAADAADDGECTHARTHTRTHKHTCMSRPNSLCNLCVVPCT